VDDGFYSSAPWITHQGASKSLISQKLRERNANLLPDLALSLQKKWATTGSLPNDKEILFQALINAESPT
jgi:hypothetical protein